MKKIRIVSIFSLILVWSGEVKGFVASVEKPRNRNIHSTGESVAVDLSIFYIGSRITVDYWNGLIDDVQIYSQALTASEIQTLYAQTKDKYLAEND